MNCRLHCSDGTNYKTELESLTAVVEIDDADRRRFFHYIGWFNDVWNYLELPDRANDIKIVAKYWEEYQLKFNVVTESPLTVE